MTDTHSGLSKVGPIEGELCIPFALELKRCFFCESSFRVVLDRIYRGSTGGFLLLFLRVLMFVLSLFSFI